jgi:hypothetical protein
MPYNQEAVLSKLHYRSTIIEVIFLDASKTMKVKKMTNAVVATYKKITGLFLYIEPDSTYGVEHLLLEDLVEGTIDAPTVYSIPLPVVKRIIVIDGKPRKTMSGVGFPVLAGKQVRVTQRRHGVGEEIGKDGTDGY